MKQWFLSQKGSRVGRGVKEKQVSTVVKSAEVNKHVNEALGSIFAIRTLKVVNVGLESFLTVSMAHGIHSRASAKEQNTNDDHNKEDFIENRVNVVVPMESIRAISEQFANNAYRYFLGKQVAYPVVANYFSSIDGLDAVLEKGPWFIRNNSYILNKWNSDVNLLKEDVALIEVRADMELKDNIMVVMSKLVRGGIDECPKNIDSDVVKNIKKHGQAASGIPVGHKVVFKAVKQVHRHVSKMNNGNASGNEKKYVKPTIEISNLNPFDVLNSVENDVDLGINDGTSNLDSNKAISSGSSFWIVEASSTNTTPINDKIDKYGKLIIDRKESLVDDEDKPLKKVAYPDDQDSEDEVDLVDNDMVRFLALKKVGFGTNSLIEQ
nr:hypothetical protein [Tanacetum cinerariifolium]